MATEHINGIDWFYEVRGKGHPVVFLHGWGADSRVWRQQASFFSEHYQVILVDLPGHGQTPWQEISIDGIACSLLELLRKVCASPVSLVGSSLGGVLALKVFAQGPEFIRSLTLTGSQPRFLKCDDYPYGLSERQIIRLAGHLERHYEKAIDQFFVSLFTREERQSLLFRWLRRFKRSEGFPQKEAMLSIFVQLKDLDARPVLKNVHVPFQLINGDADLVCQAGVEKVFQKDIRHARIELYEGCGHFPFLIQAHRFNVSLKKFLVSFAA